MPSVPTPLLSASAGKLSIVHILVVIFVEASKLGHTNWLEEHFHTTGTRVLVYWHFLFPVS